MSFARRMPPFIAGLIGTGSRYLFFYDIDATRPQGLGLGSTSSIRQSNSCKRKLCPLRRL